MHAVLKVYRKLLSKKTLCSSLSGDVSVPYYTCTCTCMCTIVHAYFHINFYLDVFSLEVSDLISEPA